MMPHSRIRRSLSAARRARLGSPFAAVPGPEQLEPRLVLALTPTAEEQYMLELLNRMRVNPSDELALLTSSLTGVAMSQDPDINAALNFFNVSGPILQSQWNTLTPVSPLAWDEALYNMAELQSQNMILDDTQSHNLPGRPTLAQRATQFGYNYTILGENIFAFGESVLHAHAAFAIDWGSGPNGIQNPPGHRQAMMSSQFREVGIRILPETSQSTQVGPLVVTQNFGNRVNFGNAWLLGVVYKDMDEDGFYSVGEGLGGVTITAVGDQGPIVTTSLAEGGYQLALPPGTYTLTISGGGFGSPATFPNIVVGTSNVKIDAVLGNAPPAPMIQVLGNGTVIALGDATPDPADHTAFGSIDIEAGAIVRTFTVRNGGGATLMITGLPRVTIAGDDAGAFTLVMDLALASIDPQGSLTFQISFDPATVGDFTATVRIISDDPINAEYGFEISGSGVSVPLIGVRTQQGTPVPDNTTTVSPELRTNFGARNVVREVSNRVWVITNDGSAALDLSGGVRIMGLHAQDFRIIRQPDAVLMPGHTTTFHIRFNPSQVGFRQARIVIDTNDPDTARYNFAIRGRGFVTPIISIRGNNRLIEHQDSTPRPRDGTDFGRVNVDGRSRLATFAIRNDGRGVLRLTGPVKVRVAGQHADDFRLVRIPASPVQSGTRTTFDIRFNPSDVGRRFAWIVITSNDPLTPTYTFRISGEGFSRA
ncbi:MAG: choice-of-anchor D domain-containing protein [Phycisphaeraceae bacterium]|nr:choice-of-anchor D domain-containing protein [Phycisphaeraceae bacterium]